MKHYIKTTYKTEMDSVPLYTLKDSLLQNSLNTKKAHLSSRFSKDNISSDSTINLRGKSYDPQKRNQDLISSDFPNKRSNEFTNTSSLINRNCISKISPVYNTTNSGNKKYNSNIAPDTLINNSSSFGSYSKLTGKENIKPSTKILGNFLPDKPRDKFNKKTLILDLDETLVHSTFNQLYMKSDIILNIELDRKRNVIHVLKRPGVDEFLTRMAKHYEVVIFTASVSPYANPLINQLDTKKCVLHRLYREHCTMLNGNFIKDMRKLGRNLKDVIILDNNPSSYTFNKENGLPIKTWINDKRDKELYNMTPILEFLANVDDVRDYIKKFVCGNEINYNTAYSIIKSQKVDNDLNVFRSYSPVRSSIKATDTPRQNININIINNNYSNYYLDKNSNLVDRISNQSKRLEDTKSAKENDNNIKKYATSSNLFRSSYNNLRDNNYMKVSATKFTPIYLNSSLAAQKRENIRDKPIFNTNYLNDNYDSYFDKNSLVDPYSNKKNEQYTPSRTNNNITKSTNKNLNEYLDKNYPIYSRSVDKNHLSSSSTYLGSNLNNKTNKISNQLKSIERDMINRGTESYRNQISKSLERPNTSNYKLNSKKTEDISAKIYNRNDNINSYTPNRLLNPSDKLMTYTTSFFDRNNSNSTTNYSRSVDRKRHNSPNIGSVFESNYNSTKYDDIDTLYTSKVYNNGNSKYKMNYDTKPYKSSDSFNISSRDNLYYYDRDSLKYSSIKTNSLNNKYSQTMRDRFDQFSINKY